MTDSRMFCVAAAAALTLVAAVAGAHPATEHYIPIGESPGVSGKSSYTSVIEERDDGRHLIEVLSTRGVTAVRIGEGTRIYLDRSSVGKANLVGSYSDCRPGRRIEVKFVDNDPAKPAEWIKVRIDN